MQWICVTGINSSAVTDMSQHFVPEVRGQQLGCLLKRVKNGLEVGNSWAGTRGQISRSDLIERKQIRAAVLMQIILTGYKTIAYLFGQQYEEHFYRGWLAM